MRESRALSRLECAGRKPWCRPCACLNGWADFPGLEFRASARGLRERPASVPVKVRDRVDDVMKLHFVQLREDRQSERVLRRPLGMREVAFAMLQIGEALLQMKRHRVVDLGANAGSHEVLSKR